MAIKRINLSGHFNQDLEDQGFTFPGSLNVDLGDPKLNEKVIEWLDQNLQLTDEDLVWIALPGLPRLRDVVIAYVHGRTGQFPITICPRRTDEGFVFDQVVDMQEIRNQLARRSRHNSVEL